MISTERHSQHQAMEELQDFKLADLFAKLRLDDDEFHEWLADIGLLHGSRTCTRGNLMKIELAVEVFIGAAIVRCIDHLNLRSASKLAPSSKTLNSIARPSLNLLTYGA